MNTKTKVSYGLAVLAALLLLVVTLIANSSVLGITGNDSVAAAQLSQKSGNEPRAFVFQSLGDSTVRTEYLLGSDPMNSRTQNSNAKFSIPDIRDYVTRLAAGSYPDNYVTYSTADDRWCAFGRKTLTLRSSYDYRRDPKSITQSFSESDCTAITARSNTDWPWDTTIKNLKKGVLKYLETRTHQYPVAGGSVTDDEVIKTLIDSSGVLYALMGGSANAKYTSVAHVDIIQIEAGGALTNGNVVMGELVYIAEPCNNRCNKKIVSPGGYYTEDVTPKSYGSGEEPYFSYDVSVTSGPILTSGKPSISQEKLLNYKSAMKNGASMTIYGTGFSLDTDNFVTFNVGTTSLLQISELSSPDGKSLKFTLPSSKELAPGDYTVQVGTAASDWSNSIPLTITASTSTVPVVTASYTATPAGGVGYGNLYTVTFKWSATNASSCSGSLNGKTLLTNLPASGSYSTTLKLDGSTVVISCIGPGGTGSKSLILSPAKTPVPSQVAPPRITVMATTSAKSAPTPITLTATTDPVSAAYGSTTINGNTVNIVANDDVDYPSVKIIWPTSVKGGPSCSFIGPLASPEGGFLFDASTKGYSSSTPNMQNDGTYTIALKCGTVTSNTITINVSHR